MAASSPAASMLFLTTLTTALRQNMPRPYMLTHSVWPRWFSASDPTAGSIWSASPESPASVNMDDIDYVNGMYYGTPTIWDTCSQLMDLAVTYPGTSFGETVAAGKIPASKLLVGRMMVGGNTFSDGIGTNLGDCLKGRDIGGVATWQYSAQYPAYTENLVTVAGLNIQ